MPKSSQQFPIHFSFNPGISELLHIIFKVHQVEMFSEIYDVHSCNICVIVVIIEVEH